MIAPSGRASVRNPGLGLLALIALSASGCRGPQDSMNSVQEADWLRRITHGRSEWRAAEAELWRIRERTRQLREDAASDAVQLESARAKERTEAAELRAALDLLVAIEQDLADARKRKAAADKEMAEVRQLEAEVAVKDARLAALREQLEQKVASLRAKETEVQGLVAQIDQKLASLAKVEEIARRALQAVWGLAPTVRREGAAEESAGGKGAGEESAGAKAPPEKGGAKKEQAAGK